MNFSIAIVIVDEWSIIDLQPWFGAVVTHVTAERVNNFQLSCIASVNHGDGPKFKHIAITLYVTEK
jgi:hypothetical protein